MINLNSVMIQKIRYQEKAGSIPGMERQLCIQKATNPIHNVIIN